MIADLSHYRDDPAGFLFRYLKRRPFAHGAIILSVLGAVGASVATQFAVKLLVDALTSRTGSGPLIAVAAIASLVAADNLPVARGVLDRQSDLR